MKLTGWRRIAAAMWRAPTDPQIYGNLDVDAGPVLRLIDAAKARGVHLTPTVVAGRAVAHALRAVPELNVRLLGGHAVPRKTIDVFFITAVGGGGDLSGVRVDRADEKGAIGIAEELARRAKSMKQGNDPDFKRTKNLMESLPVPLLRVALKLSSIASNQLGLDVPALGVRRHSFGSAMITSVGMFGLPGGFAPISWMYDVPILVAVGQIAERPVAVDAKVIARMTMPLGATIDHRFVDGWHLSRALTALREYLDDPARFEPALAESPQPVRELLH